ncbi:zinc finger SWIM domain-containing protein 7-like [Physella acuta]|uniref:zinc finger SWIM domain-containing protein 7-like n=1 Tax=Physella acuta TaxID=109671 RepID=UPI0027DB78F6|nr:zinc finger SWIM domain-containing protein 7-like [Physella acuta]XP_059149614.1 zinc finger SWIM domain-containing protein 7-like [Physella acuta]
MMSLDLTNLNHSQQKVKEAQELVEHLMLEVKNAYTLHGKLSDDLLSLLNFTFQGLLLSALELVEKQSVTKIVSPSGRALFQVVGASGTPYTCFARENYCSCPAYHFSVLRKEDHMMCKHVLAVKLSEAMGKSKSLSVSDAEVTHIIMSIE